MIRSSSCISPVHSQWHRRLAGAFGDRFFGKHEPEVRLTNRTAFCQDIVFGLLLDEIFTRPCVIEVRITQFRPESSY